MDKKEPTVFYTANLDPNRFVSTAYNDDSFFTGFKFRFANGGLRTELMLYKDAAMATAALILLFLDEEDRETVNNNMAAMKARKEVEDMLPEGLNDEHHL